MAPRRQKTIPKPAIYARISRDDAADGLGVERQRSDLIAYCASRGWPAPAEYVDNDSSASRYARKRRERFEAMLADITSGAINTVVVAELSRYTREPRIVEDLIDAADAGAVELVSLQGGEYDVATPEGKMRLRTEAMFAAGYSDFISLKVRRKKRELVDRGEGPGGSRPFGYLGAAPGRKAGHVIDEREADAYRQAVADVIGGTPMITIARRWNDAGFRTPKTGSLWGVPSVRSTLTNARHAGLLVQAGADGARQIIGPACWPAIITREDHERVVRVLNDPARRHRNPPRRGVLTGMVRCSCGHTMRMDGRYFRCRRLPERPDACGATSIAAGALEALIADAVLDYLDSDAFAAALERAQVAAEAEDPSFAGMVAALDADRARLAELGDAYADGTLDRAEYRRLTERVKARIEVAEVAISGTVTASTPLVAIGPDLRANLRDAWAEMTPAERREVLLAVLDHVTVAPAERRGGPAFDPARITTTWRW